jgi:hypothetical protein
MNPEQTAGGETSGFPPEDTGRRRGPQAIPATSTTSSVSRNSSSSKASATVHRNVLTGTHAAWRTTQSFGYLMHTHLVLSASPAATATPDDFDFE